MQHEYRPRTTSTKIMTLHINTNNAAHTDRDPVGQYKSPLTNWEVRRTHCLHLGSYLIKGHEDVLGSLFVRGLCDGAARLIHALRQVTETQTTQSSSAQHSLRRSCCEIYAMFYQLLLCYLLLYPWKSLLILVSSMFPPPPFVYSQFLSLF